MNAIKERLGNLCAMQSIYCRGPLQIDHKDGRDYRIETLGGNRLNVYEREAREGRLRLLCRYHNARDGAIKKNRGFRHK